MDGAAETIELPEVNAGDRAGVARKKNLDLALAQIAKDFGEGAIMRLGDNHVSPVEVIPTGNILIDRALGGADFRAVESLRFSAPSRLGKRL
jgi:recombination protein RecA